MSPSEFREIREGLGLTQEELAKPLGVAKLTISQYETGFRKPGKTVEILMSVLNFLSQKKALELLELMRRQASSLDGHWKSD